MNRDSSSDCSEATEKLLEDSTHHVPQKESVSAARQNKLIIVIVTLQICALSVDSLIYPFFPRIAKQKGLTSTQIGIVFSSYDFVIFVTSPFVGTALSRWPPKKFGAAGSIIIIISCAAFGTLDKVTNKELFFILCIVIRLIAGLGTAMLTVSSTCILLKCTTYRISTIMSIVEIALSVSFFVGPSYGAVMFNLTGYSPMFWLIGGLILVALSAFLILVPQIEKGESSAKGILGLLEIPGCLLMMLQCAIIRIVGGTRITGMGVWFAATFGLDASMVGALYVLIAVSSTLSCFIYSKTVLKKYLYGPLVIGSVGVAINDLLMGPSQILDFIFHQHKYLWLSLSGVFVFNIFYPLAMIPTLPAAMDLALVNGYQEGSVHTYGIVTGLINCGISLGATIGPTLAGVITDALNYTWALTIASFLNFAMAIFFLLYLAYMRATNQPLAPIKQQLEETTTIEKGVHESREDCIASACDEQMKSCLTDYGGITRTHQQQPAMED